MVFIPAIPHLFYPLPMGKTYTPFGELSTNEKKDAHLEIKITFIIKYLQTGTVLE